nr:uncharacterized protein LOC112915796 [Vulpes vulpes]
MASFGLGSAVQPLLRPLSGGRPGSPQAGFAGPTFCLQLESGELDSLARILPAERIPQLQAGALPRAPRGAAWLRRPGGSAPAARSPQPAPPGPRTPDPGPRSRSAASVQQPEGGAGGAQAASGRDPSRRVAGKPGGNSFFPHSAPRGCRRRKRRRRREDRPRLGEEETLSGSASGQPEPGTPSERNEYTRHFGALGAPLLLFVRSHWLFQVSPCGKSRQHGARKPFCKKFRAVLGCLQGAVGGPLWEEARGEKTKKLLAFKLNHWMYLGWSCEPVV